MLKTYCYFLKLRQFQELQEELAKCIYKSNKDLTYYFTSDKSLFLRYFTVENKHLRNLK